MWFKRKQTLESKEYQELKQLFSTLSIQVAALEADFSNLTKRVLKKIRNSRPSIEEDTGAEEKEKLFKGVMLPDN